MRVPAGLCTDAPRTLWKANLPIPKELQQPGKALTLMVKAADANYNVQPETIEFPDLWQTLPMPMLCVGFLDL